MTRVEDENSAATARVAIGSYYWATGRIADAERSYAAAARLDPGSVTANRALANLYLATGRTAEAEMPLRAAADASDDPEPRLSLADYYIALGRFPDARGVLDRLTGRPESFAVAATRLAAIEYRNGSREAAHGMLDAVLAREPANARVIAVKGWWLLAERRLDEALSRSEAAVTHDPESAQARFVLASVLHARGELPRAVATFNEVLGLDPRAVDAQIALANLHLELGRPDMARQFADQALENEPRRHAARLALARVLVAERQFERARSELKLLVDAAPEVAEVHVLFELCIDDVLFLPPGSHVKRYFLDFDPLEFVSRFRLTWVDDVLGIFGGVTPATDITPFGEFLSADGLSHGEVEDYVSEPLTLTLLGMGIAGGVLRRRRRWRELRP